MKTRWSLIAAALVLVSTNAFARISDGKVHFSLQASKLVGTVDPGFHFNKDAPAALVVGDVSVEPSPKNPKGFTFDTSKVKGKPFSVNFYVCDDKNTVCEAHDYRYLISKGSLVLSTESQAKPESAIVAAAPQGAMKKNHHGFYEDNLVGALALATKDNKLVLVDFGAPWCPSCIRLETEVFGEQVFQKSAANLIKVSLNVDRVSNKDYSKQYDIKAIPTLILMNSKGQELARMMDFKPAHALAKELDGILTKQLTSVEELIKKAEAGDQAASKTLAERAFYSVNYAEVVKWLSPLKQNSLMLANAEVSVLGEKYEGDGKGIRNGYIKTLEKWIAAYPNSLESISWRVELMKVLKGEGKDITPAMKDVGAKNIAVIENLLKSGKAREEAFSSTLAGDYTGFEKIELWAQLKDTYKGMEDTAKTAQAKAELVKQISALKLSEKRPGEVLVALGYMKQADMKREMVNWYQKLIKTHPKTDVYYTKLARFYIREKQYAKALPLAKKAAAIKSDLALYNMQTLAEVHKELKQNKEAASVVTKALAMPEAKLEQNKKTVASLEEIKKSLPQ